MDPESDPLVQLSAGFRNRDGTDRWRVWANNGRLYAWKLLSSPPAVLRDTTVGGLRTRMAEFERVLSQSGRLSTALAAAEALDTEGMQ